MTRNSAKSAHAKEGHSASSSPLCPRLQVVEYRGDASETSDACAFPLRRQDHLLLLITAPCCHVIDFEPMDFAPGDVLFAGAGVVEEWDGRHSLSGVGIRFSREAAQTFLRSFPDGGFFDLRYEKRLHPSPERFALMKSVMSILQTEAAGNANNNPTETCPGTSADAPISSDSMALLAAHLVSLAVPPQNPEPQAVLDAKRFRTFAAHVWRGHADSREAASYAEKLGISTNRLSIVVKAKTGVPAKTWIDRVVVLAAKRRLATEDIPVETLAHELGFAEPTQFVKFFLRIAGMTPGGFRKTLAQKDCS